MDKFLKILQIAGEIGGILALLVAPYLYFENRKLRRLAAHKNKRIAQEELEKLKRTEETAFNKKMESLPTVYGRAFEMEGFDTAETQREVDKAVQRKENYLSEEKKLKAVIEEQEEIENMSTFRGLFGLKSKNDLLLLVPKRTLKMCIREKLKKLFTK